MSQQAFFFDGTRCSGCKTCMFACKDAYDLDVGTAYRRVYEYTGGDTVRADDGTFSGRECFFEYELNFDGFSGFRGVLWQPVLNGTDDADHPKCDYDCTEYNQ